MIHIDGLGLVLGIMTFVAITACIVETMMATKSPGPWQLRLVHVGSVYCFAIFGVSVAYLISSFLAEGSDLQDQLVDGRLRHFVGAIATAIGILIARRSAKGWAQAQPIV